MAAMTVAVVSNMSLVVVFAALGLLEGILMDCLIISFFVKVSFLLFGHIHAFQM